MMESQTTAGMDSSLRLVRIVHLALLASVILYVGIGEAISVPPSQADLTLLMGVFAVVAVSVTVALFVLRRAFIGSAEERLRVAAEDSAALARWRVGHIVIFALAESIALFGLVLRLLGLPLAQAAYFYAAGIALLLLFTPRRPR